MRKGNTPWNKGKKMSLAMREKMRGNKNGIGGKGKTISKESRQKMSLAKLGKPSPRKGKKLSIETREKISVSKRKSSIDTIIYDDRKRVRRERIKVYGGCHSNTEWETLKAQYNWTCPNCKNSEPKIKLTRDHIIAISKSGSDNIENIQPLCVSCNSRKSTRAIRY